MTILDKIIDATKRRVIQQTQEYPIEEIISSITSPNPEPFRFERVLRDDCDISLICEIKKASPSKGIIAKDFPYTEIAVDYESAGADAISVLTEPDFFQGSDKFLQDVKAVVSIPVIRKDFIIDPYQIYQSRYLGADAILLICAALTDIQLRDHIQIADSLGLSCLVEAHDETEVRRALDAGARIVGVNNRDLKTFEVDIKTSEHLRGMVPPDVIFVSESGVRSGADIERLRVIGADAALIGETLMLSPDRKAEIKSLRGGKYDQNKDMRTNVSI